MFYPFLWLYRDKLVAGCTLVLTVSLAIAGSFLAFSFRDVPDVVPFWYSLPWSEARLAPRNYLLYLLLGSFLIGSLQISTVRFFKHAPSLVYILVITASLQAVLMSITVIEIVSLWNR